MMAFIFKQESHWERASLSISWEYREADDLKGSPILKENLNETSPRQILHKYPT